VNTKSELIVALDGLADREHETLCLAEQLAESPSEFGFKGNIDYFLEKGWEAGLKRLQRICSSRNLFVDLKLLNGSRTIRSVIERLIDRCVSYVSVAALADEELQEALAVANGTSTKVLALTVMTHFDESYCKRHFRRSLRETVQHFSETARDRGCDGIIVPGTMLSEVKDLPLLKVVSGIRPKWFKDYRHSQEIEPRVAVEQGADILVCGSPIVKTERPRESLEKILSEMEQALSYTQYRDELKSG